MLRIAFPILFLLMTTAACGGQTQMQKHDMKVGGCVIDTIPLGLDMPKSDPGRIPERITIKAVHDAGRETFVRAARELAEILRASGVAVFGRSELIHVTEGACWPPWMITFEVDLQGAEKVEAARKAVLGSSIAGLQASETRPGDYGRFFVSAGKGSSDLWTVWFDGASPAGEKENP